MMAARLDGTHAWCGHVGCPGTTPLAALQWATDGTQFARLLGRRWRRDGRQDGMERYITVQRRRRYAHRLPDGRIETTSGPEYRAERPVVVVCPSCDAVQAIGLDP